MSKKPVNIHWYDADKRTRNILQIYKKGLEFAFVSNANEQCHPFVFCKDFLQLVIFSNIHEKSISLFNFNYNPKKNPVSLDKLRIILRNTSDADFIKKIENAVVFINYFEKTLKIKQTKFCLCENNTVLFVSSKRWLKSPPLISMYMLLVRIGMIHEKDKPIDYTINGILQNKIKPYQLKDFSLLKNSLYGIKKILEDGDRKSFYKDIKKNYPDINLMTIHKDGILFYSTELSRINNKPTQVVSHW